MSSAMLYALLVLAALATGALVAAPLRHQTPRLFAAIVLLMPLLAFPLYRMVGTPAALDPGALQAGPGGQGPTMAEAIAELEAALARDPQQPEGWRLLGRAHAAQGERIKARDAFMKAVELIPDDPDLLIETAQARAQAAPGNQFDDTALAQLRQAQALDPANQRAAWFIGVVQRQRGEDAAAVATWEALLPALDAATAAALRSQIDEARAAAGMPPLPPQTTAQGNGSDTQGPGVRVRVSLDPEFASRARLDGDATVFVIARAIGGPPMPVAVERHALRDLPLELVLDDADSLMPTAKLSSLPGVELVARISATGSADRAEGDLESAPLQVPLPADGPVDLVIGAPAR